MVLGAFVSVRQLSWVIMFKDTQSDGSEHPAPRV